MATRWGICSTGQIANDFCTALKDLPASDHEVVAVAAREDASKAKVFAEKYGIPNAYATYLQMALDQNVDVVYVATTEPYHHPVSLLFLEHGKAVVCEKPVTVTRDQCQALVDTARKSKVFFMEGMWTRFFPGFLALREELESGRLGNVNCVRASFCVNIERLDSGALFALSSYLLQYAQLVFPEFPQRIVAIKQTGEGGGDVGGSILLHYKEGGMAVLYYSIKSAFGASTATFHGTKGNLEVHDVLHNPTRLTLTSGETKTFPLPLSPSTFNLPGSEGFVYQAEAVRQCLKKGMTECPQMTHDDSLTIMGIMEEVKRQMDTQ